MKENIKTTIGVSAIVLGVIALFVCAVFFIPETTTGDLLSALRSIVSDTVTIDRIHIPETTGDLRNALRYVVSDHVTIDRVPIDTPLSIPKDTVK